MAADHLATEGALADARPDVTLLRHSWYGDVVAHGLAPMAVRSGRWTINTGQGQVAPIAKDDAAAAAAACSRRTGTEARPTDITGPAPSRSATSPRSRPS